MIKSATQETIGEAALRLRSGEIVAFPTETVYGLGADATNGQAASRIFETKARPTFNPLIVHVESTGMARKLGHMSEEAEKLCQAFWPGPLTLVLPRTNNCPATELVSAGLPTIAIRQPNHPVAQQLIERAGCPIAAPSANRSGHISPTRAVHVAQSLSDPGLLIIDGGECSAGLESTVVKTDRKAIYILRHGAVTAEELEAAMPHLTIVSSDETSSAPQSPGQLASHYAPRHPLRLNANTVEEAEALLAFGKPCPGAPYTSLNLSRDRDLREAAANLFAHLHALDASGCERIAVMPIPNTGLGRAINDRLTRAAQSSSNRVESR